MGNWGDMLWGGASAVPLVSPVGFVVLAIALLTIGVVLTRRHAARWVTSMLAVAVIAIPLVAYAGIIAVPNTFTNGTIADADEVNANFSTLVTESNAQHSRITALEGAPVIQIRSLTVGVIPGGNYTVSVNCFGSEQVVGGGVEPHIALDVHWNYPDSSTSWTCLFTNNTATARNATCHAICADF